MREGDPFNTEALDQQRSRQRRWLRTVLLAQIEENQQTSATTHLRTALGQTRDPEQLEVALRFAADLVAEHEIAADEFTIVARLRMALTDAMKKAQTSDLAYGRLEEIEAALSSKGPKPLEGGDPRPDPAVVMLLLLADEVATDDYKDPRLP